MSLLLGGFVAYFFESFLGQQQSHAACAQQGPQCQQPHEADDWRKQLLYFKMLSYASKENINVFMAEAKRREERFQEEQERRRRIRRVVAQAKNHKFEPKLDKLEALKQHLEEAQRLQNPAEIQKAQQQYARQFADASQLINSTRGRYSLNALGEMGLFNQAKSLGLI